MDVGVWLRSLGLGQYEAAFRDNEIDGEVLPNLTAEDLKDLGVSIVGHRRKLLLAIGALSAAPAPLPPVAKAVAEPTPAAAFAERRQLTVMFVDLVGSTALSARLDPEDMREVVGAYHRLCEGLIVSAGGFVAKYMGDGVLAYFGYPQAHEHDAERAVQTGLALVVATPKLNTVAGVPLAVRVGIATGLVVVGDLIGTGAAQEQAVVGETPNLAARLQGIAEPNMVVIAEGTRNLLGELFELEDLGAKELKGILGPVRSWAALRASSVESRFEALHTTGLTALVGREEEFESLLRRWSKAKTGEGQVVLLSGEAGIGKSRLTAALLQRLADEPHTRLRYFCSPQHTDSAFYPIIGQLGRAAGLARDDTPATKLDKLDALLKESATSREDAALMADMLSLQNDGRYPARELAPQQRRQQTIEALIAQIDAISRQRTVLMIFEDAHWADPTSLEVFGLLIDRIQTMRVLLFVTYRPEFAPAWIGRPQVTALTLNRLGQSEVGALIDRVVGNKVLPTHIRRDIVERADGIPLFVEEMTKAVLEAESEDAATRTIAAVPSPALAIPASLHASLMARLDRLGSAKEAAQTAAVIGREFSRALLSAVSPLPEAELQVALDRLLEAELIYRRGMSPAAIYVFKHALVRDAAYGSLLRTMRQLLHARIGDALEAGFPETATAEPELLAQHFTAAGQVERAVSYWYKSGERALQSSASLEALRQLTKGLELLDGLPNIDARNGWELEFLATLGSALIVVKGYAHPEVERVYSRAWELCENLGDSPHDWQVLHGLWRLRHDKAEFRTAVGVAEQLMNLAERRKDVGLLVAAHRSLFYSQAALGNLKHVRWHMREVEALYDRDRHRGLAYRLGGADPKVATLCQGAWIIWALGYADEALRDNMAALTLAREIKHPFSEAAALTFMAATHLFRGEARAMRDCTDEMLQATRDQNFAVFQGWAHILRGQSLAHQGANGDAVVQTEMGLACLQTVTRNHLPFWMALLAEAHAGNGQPDEGALAICQAIDEMTHTSQHFWESEVYRVQGEILLQRDGQAKPDESEACFHRAIRVAHAQSAKSWELRAATSLARLWRDQGKRNEACELLAAAYGWFTEGFDTRDLKEAKALLDTLES
jgi:class 3 adenylate cyclase